MDTKNLSFECVKQACKAIDDKMGIDTIVLEVGEQTVLGDYFVISSANNPNQLSAMADAVEENIFKNTGKRLHHAEGFASKKWILLDFGDIVVHLLDKESREFYNIEHIWADAKKIDVAEILK